MPAGGREQYEALYQDLLRLLTKAAGRMLDDRAEREETDGEDIW